MSLDAVDRRIVEATQEGLPLDPQPYHCIAQRLDLEPADVMARMERLLADGAIRRMGVIPNHYALGFRHNGMSVWDVPDDRIEQLGQRVGALDFVSHCYQRPRHPPRWPYNLFAMVHGRSEAEMRDMVARIAAVLGDAVRGHEVLSSSRILKKAGLRLTGGT